MTGPIIDPMWFYWLQVCDTIRWFLLIAAIIVLSGCALMAPALCESYGDEHRKFRNIMIAFAVFGLVLIVAGMMIPSKETMIQMEIARHVTYESTESVIQTITNTASYLLEKLTEGGK